MQLSLVLTDKIKKKKFQRCACPDWTCPDWYKNKKKTVIKISSFEQGRNQLF